MFNFFRRKKKAVNSPAAINLGCVARHVLADLDTKNADKWKIHLGAGEYYDEAWFIEKGYALHIAFNFDEGASLPTHSISFSGVESFSFTPKESEEIYRKFNELIKFNDALERQKALDKDKETMKKWFPDCFK
jgi:hypothetical protein